jgi:hypothetical protein
MDNKRKITAAISAVINYMQDEEAALYLNAAMAAQVPAMISPALAEPPLLTVPALTTGCSAPASLWGTSGRQSQMQLRNLMQLRAFNRF